MVTATPSAQAAPVPAASAAATNAAGDVVKKLGERAELGEEGKPAVASAQITKVSIQDSCTAFDGSEYRPAKGSVLYRLDLSAQLTNEAANVKGLDFLVVAADSFQLTGSGGTVLAQSGDSATSLCLEQGDRMPPSVVPGESVAGAMFLEAPAGAERIVWNPWGVDGSGWEWAIK